MSSSVTDDRVGMDSLIRGLKEIESKAVIVGVMEDEDEKIQVIASANEYGAEIKSPKALLYMRMLAKKFGVTLKGPKKDKIIIPERSYIRSAADDTEVQDKIAETVRFYLYRAVTAQNTFGEVLTRAGNYFQRIIQGRMENTPPPNHPLTLAMKTGDKTLRGNSGKLMASIKYKVVDKNES